MSFDYKETIGRISPEGKGEIFIKMPKGSTTNGIRLWKSDTLFIADYTGHNVLKSDLNGVVSVHAHNPDMNQPNDLALKKDGTLFASDPNWKDGNGQLWRIDLDGSTHLLEKNMGTTNGIEVSPDESKLYVNESKQRRVWVYDLSPNGEISNKKLFYQFEDGGLDGMRCDTNGNLYITRWGSGKVVKLSPEGKRLKIIPLRVKNQLI